MHPFIESLESRELLSVAFSQPEAVGTTTTDFAALRATPHAAAKGLVGTYKGNLTIPAVAHFKSVVMRIQSLAKSGAFKGTLSAPGVSLKISGKRTSKGFSIAITGTHPGGPINGTGTGTFDTGYKHLKISMSFKSGSQNLPGTIAVTRA